METSADSSSFGGANTSPPPTSPMYDSASVSSSASSGAAALPAAASVASSTQFKPHAPPTAQPVGDAAAADDALAAAKALEAPHESTKRHACTQEGCTKSFAFASGVRQHVREVHRRVTVPCPHDGCTVRAAPGNIRRHVLYVHQGQRRVERKKPCPQCGKMLGSTNLPQHLRAVHGGQRPFACRVCGKTFTKSAHVTRHENGEHMKRRFFCLIRGCGASFSSASSTITSHLRNKHHIVDEYEQFYELRDTAATPPSLEALIQKNAAANAAESRRQLAELLNASGAAASTTQDDDDEDDEFVPRRTSKRRRLPPLSATEPTTLALPSMRTAADMSGSSSSHSQSHSPLTLPSISLTTAEDAAHVLLQLFGDCC
eukprot:TRINITY_DN962_c0_g1_i3.p1 TRINITY_DN962_c0_g1~~TRINITY_DN962_c0_g1_i3.p1  ORF type:complete len:373 (-),score=183.37 TRINITY_DN962_c0_g1_i3:123-1241(-)